MRNSRRSAVVEVCSRRSEVSTVVEKHSSPGGYRNARAKQGSRPLKSKSQRRKLPCTDWKPYIAAWRNGYRRQIRKTEHCGIFLIVGSLRWKKMSLLKEPSTLRTNKNCLHE